MQFGINRDFIFTQAPPRACFIANNTTHPPTRVEGATLKLLTTSAPLRSGATPALLGESSAHVVQLPVFELFTDRLRGKLMQINKQLQASLH